MKSKIIILLFINSLCFGQNKYDINLPIAKFPIVHNTQPINILVDKNKNIFLEGKSIKLNSVADSIMRIKSKMPLHQRNNLSPNLYIDRNLKYTYVQKILNELSSAYIFIVVYSINSIDSKRGIKQNIPRPFLYKKYKENIEESVGSTILEDVDLPGLAWQPKIEQYLYQLKFNKAKEILKEKTFSIINFKSKNIVEIDKEKISLNQVNQIIEKLRSKDILFVTYQESITYGEYIEILSKLRNREKVFIGLHSIGFERRKYIDFIEISNKLQKIMKKQKIKI